MIHQYLNRITDTDLSKYVIIIIIAAVIGYRIKVSNHVIFGLIIGLIIVFYMYDRAEMTGDTFLSYTNEVLSSPLFNPYKHLYLDSELVIFLDQHREYYQYNPAGFRMLLKEIDIFLMYRQDIERGTQLYHLDYNLLRAQKTKILNSYHSLIHKLPHISNSIDKFHLGMKRLTDLINGHVDEIHQVVKTKSYNSEIDTNTEFIYISHPKPDDPDYSANWNFFQADA